MVTIVIPTFSRPYLGYKFLPMIMSCCIRQVFRHWRALILCREKIHLPIDEAERLANRYVDKKKFRLLVHDLDNIWKIRNFAIDTISDELIANFDDDDYYGPKYLSLILRNLKCEHPGNSKVPGIMYSLSTKKFTKKVLFIGEATHVMKRREISCRGLRYIPYFERVTSRVFPQGDITGWFCGYRQSIDQPVINQLYGQYINFRSGKGFIEDTCRSSDKTLLLLRNLVGDRLFTLFYEPLIHRIGETCAV